MFSGLPFSPTSGVMKLSRFRAYSALESSARRLGTLACPTMVTPCRTTTLPDTDRAQLPPVSTARSTITEPGFMSLTMASVISTGAFLPGISAVQMAMSCFFRCSWMVASCFFL